MDVLFLDANVLFSAAYSAGSRLQLLWEIPAVELVTSTYAVEEARRNLPQEEQRQRLEALLRQTRLVAEAGFAVLPDDVLLPQKDQPILSAAIAAEATHLITGDRTHFGAWFGKRIGNLLVLPPAVYINKRFEQEQERKISEPG
ncbi:MAG TPA: PIN domain-containing protein [Longimicrobium sp.]